MTIHLLRLPEVLKQRGVSRSSHYLDIQKNLFTTPVQIGTRSVAWPSNEVEQLNAARIAGKPNEEIKNLVQKLERLRKSN